MVYGKESEILMSVNDIIKDVLSADKTARTDDNYLYGRVIEEMAKETGSTVEAIRNANRLAGEPEDDRILLIPVS